jgi:hypothetical protein
MGGFFSCIHVGLQIKKTCLMIQRMPVSFQWKEDARSTTLAQRRKT